MDLKNLAVAETATLELRHPVTEEVIEGMEIVFYGPTSAIVKKMTMQKSQAALDRLSKGKKAASLDAEKLTEDAIVDSFKRAVSWGGFELDGKKLDLTEANWKMVMNDYPWVQEQVSTFLNDSGSFLV